MRKTVACLSLAVLVAAGIGMPRAQETPSIKEETYHSLRRAFAWLVAQQNENGAFGRIPGMDPKAGEAGISALALRAMAKAPESIRRELNGPMEKTARYLQSLQAPDGSITNPGAGLTTYRTSIALMAFHAYDKERMAMPIKKAREFLEKSQWSEEHGLPKSAEEARKHPSYGGWGYDPTGTKPDADMSNSHFAIEALREAGLPEDSPVWERAITFLQRCQNRSESNDLRPAGVKIGNDGGFMYDPAQDHTKSEPQKLPDGTVQIPSYASITYAGLMSLLHARVKPEDPRVQAAREWISRNYSLEENKGLGGRNNPQGSKQGLYYYYHTFAKALSAVGEPSIKTSAGDTETERLWAVELAGKLQELQKPDGFWVNDVKRWWEDDPVLCTCYAILALEQCYRWVPGVEPRVPGLSEPSPASPTAVPEEGGESGGDGR